MRFRVAFSLLAAFGLMHSNQFAQCQDNIATATSNSTLDFQLDKLPPASILKNIDSKIKNVKPWMGEDEVLDTLGLNQYRKRLRSNSFIRVDGAGGNWRMLLDNHLDYSLAFRDFMGQGNASCLIRMPKQKSWTKAKTSVPAVTVAELQENLNRQLVKLKLKAR